MCDAPRQRQSVELEAERRAFLGEAELAALGLDGGRSTSFDSPHAFAWHPLLEEELVVVAVEPWEALRPAAGTSWLRFAVTLLLSALIALALAQELPEQG